METITQETYLNGKEVVIEAELQLFDGVPQIKIRKTRPIDDQVDNIDAYENLQSYIKKLFEQEEEPNYYIKLDTAYDIISGDIVGRYAAYSMANNFLLGQVFCKNYAKK